MSNPSPKRPTSNLRKGLLSAAILLPILAIATQIGGKGSEAPVELLPVESYLRTQSATISSEQTLLSPTACPKTNYEAFAASKTSGIEQLASKNYAAAKDQLELAVRLCAAPEARIALNNAEIGDRPAYILVISVPASGIDPNNAVEMLRGAAQAQTQINRVGGAGPDSDKRPLKLILVDDGDSPERAKDLAKILTGDSDYAAVLGIVGHWTSDVSLAAASIYNSAQAIAFITPVSTADQVTRGGEWTFRTTINNSGGACALAKYMLESWGKQKAAVFYVDNVTYSTEIFNEFKSVVEKPVVNDEGEIVAAGEIVDAYDFSDPNFSARRTVREAKRQGAEVLLLATDNASTPKAFEVMSEANKIGGLKVLGDLANLYKPETLKQPNNASAGMVMATAWDINGTANDDFKAEARALWKGDVSAVTATTYSATVAMAEAMKKGATRTEIQSELNDDSFSSPSAYRGTLQFSQGDLKSSIQLIEVIARNTEAGDPEKLDFDPVRSISNCPETRR